MFGMGFMEIFLILIVAIMALGPEKLPGALVDTAKFFKKIKGEIGDAKSSLDKELDLSGMKQDAQQLKESVSNIQNMANIDLDEIGKINSSPTMDELTSEKKLKEDEPTLKKREKISMDEGKKV